MPAELTAAEFLEHLRVPDATGVFLIGSFERRVTLFSQQHRVLNAVYALQKESWLPPRTRVAVVGGGVAGLTAAAAAEQQGCPTTLFEQHRQLLHLLAGNHTRFIHPRIIDWPNDDSEVSNAGLPLLDWTAGSAGDVADQLLEGFRRAAPGCRVCLNAHVELADVPSGEKPKLTWNGTTEQFDVVLLTVGFGIERTVRGVPLVSYWRDESLHQSDVTLGVRSFLVSGCGDGGCTDLERLCINEFKHERLVADLLSEPGLDLVKEQLLKIERDLAEVPLSEQPAFINASYRQLPIPSTFVDKLHSRLRNDTTVTLCGRQPLPFDAGSSVLNRFLVWHLLSIGKVNYVPSGVKYVEPVGAKYEVHFENDDRQIFDQVVIRHGPEPAIAQFAKIWQHRDEFRRLAAQDQTRRKLWRDDFYPPTTAAPVLSFTPPPSINRDVPDLPVYQIFSTIGTPSSHTFVRPIRYEQLRNQLGRFGRGLMVIGPSGIGKTVTVKMALRELGPPDGVPLRSGRNPHDRAAVEGIVSRPVSGHLVVDDVRSFDPPTQKRLLEEIFRIHASGAPDAKITIIDGGDDGALLIDEEPGLRNCVDIHRIGRQSDELIGKLIYEGQRWSNLRFVRPEKLVRAARGSYFLAQQLCEKAASIEGISRTATDRLKTVQLRMDAIIDELMTELEPLYQDQARAFASIDQQSPHPGVCILLLFILARAANDQLPLAVVEQSYSHLKATFTWLRDGNLAAAMVGGLKRMLHYNAQTACLTLHDPRLGFYLQNLSWVDFARHHVGVQVGFNSSGDLVLL